MNGILKSSIYIFIIYNAENTILQCFIFESNTKISSILMTIHHMVYMHIQFSHGDTEKCPKINFIIMPKDFLLLEKKI